MMKNILLVISIVLSLLANCFAEDNFFDGTDKETLRLMKRAKQSIEKHRRGPLSLRLMDSQDRPIQAHLEVKLLAHEFDFGTNLFGFHRISDDNPAKSMALDAIDDVFNTVTICDYWSKNQTKLEGRLNWESPDVGYAIADELGKRTRYHSLLFSVPQWIHEYETENELWRVIEARLKQAAERYGSRLREVDVINEFINYQYWDQNPHARYLKTTAFPDMAKPENGARALKLARKYFPNAKLVVLETNLWNVSNPVFQEIYEYHKELIRLGAPYDYIGYQAHYYAQGGMPFQKGTEKFGPRTFMMDEIDRGMEQMAKLCKPIVITEFNPPSRSNKVKDPNQPRISDEEIAAWETNFYTLMFSKPYITGVSRWFTIDNLGGRGIDAGVVTETGDLKRNYFSLKKLIQEDWHTTIEGKISDGNAWFTGFYGTYRIRVEGFEETTVNLTKKAPDRKIQLKRY